MLWDKSVPKIESNSYSYLVWSNNLFSTGVACEVCNNFSTLPLLVPLLLSGKLLHLLLQSSNFHYLFFLLEPGLHK